MSINPGHGWLVASLSLGSLGLLLGACTVDTPDAGQTPASTAGSATTAGSGSGVIPSGGTSSGGSTSAAGTSAGGTGVSEGGTFAAVAGASAGGGAPVGGSANGGMSTGAGGAVHVTTAGCGKVNAEEPGKDILHNITVQGVARRYWTKLPTGYDPSKPVPLVFYGPGCGASGVEGAPLDNSIKSDAMRVFVIGTGGCFATDAPEPETGYFNAVLDEVQANYCTDTGKVFVSGYSSGAWLSDLLACTAGDRITAIGTAAGGLHADRPTCKGNPAAMFHAGTNDGANPITKTNAQGVNEGSGAARDRLLMANGCSAETKVYDPAFPYCKEYIGCKSRVVWCQQDGVGHSNGEEVARTGWWKFWSSLP